MKVEEILLALILVGLELVYPCPSDHEGVGSRSERALAGCMVIAHRSGLPLQDADGGFRVGYSEVGSNELDLGLLRRKRHKEALDVLLGDGAAGLLQLPKPSLLGLDDIDRCLQ